MDTLNCLVFDKNFVKIKLFVLQQAQDERIKTSRKIVYSGRDGSCPLISRTISLNSEVVTQRPLFSGLFALYTRVDENCLALGLNYYEARHITPGIRH